MNLCAVYMHNYTSIFLPPSLTPHTYTHTHHVTDTSGPPYKPPIHEGTNRQHNGVDWHCFGTAPGNSHVPT